MDQRQNPQRGQFWILVRGIAISEIMFHLAEILGLLVYAAMAMDMIAPEILEGTIPPPSYLRSRHLLEEIPEEHVDLAIAIFVGVHLLIAILQLWFGFRLLFSTFENTPIVEAVELASSWRTLSIVVIILSVIFWGLLAGLITQLVYLLYIALRAGQVYIVHRYVGELEEEISRAGGAGVGGADAHQRQD